MARTYRTLSLSLPPGVVEQLTAIGKPTKRVAARVAVQIVLQEVAKLLVPTEQEDTRKKNKSWCCMTSINAVQGQLVLPETAGGDRRWVPVIALLCSTCGQQMHGREYEGWIADA